MSADSSWPILLLGAVLVPLVAILPAVMCMRDVAQHPDTRLLPPQTWIVICAFGNVVGLIAYLTQGRSENR